MPSFEENNKSSGCFGLYFYDRDIRMISNKSIVRMIAQL